MIKWIKRLNDALLGLLIGILIFSGLVEVIGVWFFADKIRYTTGLLIGTGCAVFMAINIAMVIEESVRIGPGHDKLLAVKSILRYVVVVIVFFVMMTFKLGNLYTAIIGVLGLKASAYAQPLLNKVLFKSHNKNELVPQEQQNS